MNSSQKLSSRFEEALIYATRLHACQTRKRANTPYVAHLLSVAALVLESGGNEDEAIAALLHDAVEDQGGEKTLKVIQQRFGDKVANIVKSCTDKRIDNDNFMVDELDRVVIEIERLAKPTTDE